MDLEKCFEILEVDKDTSPEKIKEAYKDIINVWHPDRFSSNLRLKEKAESKVKEINVAYETLQSNMPTRQQQQAPQEKTETRPASANRENAVEQEKPYQGHRRADGIKNHSAAGKKHKHKGKHKQKHKDKSRVGKHGHHK